MSDCLIGFTGYVGQTLKLQRHFDFEFRSTNIQSIGNEKYNIVVCAGAPAQKWLANKDPQRDQSSIENLITNLQRISCNHFVLISTVDVFSQPNGVSEDSPVNEEGLHTYGLNRRLLEKFVANQFDNHLIVRLPGLVGPGLRKNVIFDFLNRNNLPNIDSRGVFQFYPMVNLWSDIQTAINVDLRLLHLTAEPICVADIARKCFGIEFSNITNNPAAKYDMRSNYSEVFGGKGGYQYSSRESLLAIRAYAQSEPHSPMPIGGQ